MRKDATITEEERNDALQILTQGILTCNNSKFIQKYANDIDGVDIAEFEDRIIELGCAEDIVNFAKIKSANVKRLQNALMQLFNPKNGVWEYDLENDGTKENPEEIIRFAEEVPGANIEELEDKIIKLGDPYMMVEFAKRVDTANVKKIRKAIAKIDDAEDCLEELNENFEFDAVDDIIEALNDANINK